jgi:hypothetical protein
MLGWLTGKPQARLLAVSLRLDVFT